MRYCYCFLVAFFASWPSVRGDEQFDFTIRASRESAHVAEQVQITMTARCPPGWEVVVPDINDYLNDLVIIDTRTTSTNSSSDTTWQQTLTVEGWSGGQRDVQPVTVLFYSDVDRADRTAGQPVRAQRSRMATSKVLPLRIQSARSPWEWGADLRPIYGRESLPWSWWHTLAILLAALLIIGCVWWVRRMVDHLQRRGESHRRLLNSLEQLHEKWLRDELTNQEAVNELANLLRTWLQRRDPAGTIERTTEEWISWLKKHGDFSNGDNSSIATVLSRADRWKYAGIDPRMDDVRASIATVRALFTADEEYARISADATSEAKLR